MENVERQQEFLCEDIWSLWDNFARKLYMYFQMAAMRRRSFYIREEQSAPFSSFLMHPFIFIASLTFIHNENL